MLIAGLLLDERQEQFCSYQVINSILVKNRIPYNKCTMAIYHNTVSES